MSNETIKLAIDNPIEAVIIFFALSLGVAILFGAYLILKRPDLFPFITDKKEMDKYKKLWEQASNSAVIAVDLMHEHKQDAVYFKEKFHKVEIELNDHKEIMREMHQTQERIAKSQDKHNDALTKITTTMDIMINKLMNS